MMMAADYWKIFMETGAPEAYVLYNQAKRMEREYASDNSRPGTAGHGLQ